MDTSALKDIGLTDNEIRIYLSLLKHGPCLASKVAQDTGLNRTHVYDRIEKLMQKGIVSYIIRENRKYFNVISPKNLINYIEDEKRRLDSRKDEIVSMLPELEKLKKKEEAVVVEIFKGPEGVKTILNHIIDVRQTLRVIPITGTFYDLVPIFYRSYIKRARKAKMKRLIITSEDKRGLNLENPPYVKVRYLPSSFNFPSSVFTYGDYTIIYILAEEATLIRIKSKTVAKLYTNFFEEFWKISKN